MQMLVCISFDVRHIGTSEYTYYWELDVVSSAWYFWYESCNVYIVYMFVLVSCTRRSLLITHCNFRSRHSHRYLLPQTDRALFVYHVRCKVKIFVYDIQNDGMLWQDALAALLVQYHRVICQHPQTLHLFSHNWPMQKLSYSMETNVIWWDLLASMLWAKQNKMLQCRMLPPLSGQ